MQFTTKGYITVWRGDQQISRHRVAEEAYESAARHAEANGGGRYVVKYPDREVDIPVGLLAAANSGGNPLFLDEFNYTVGRLDSAASKASAFQSAGYSGHEDASDAAQKDALIYTVSSIEGDTSGIPGGGSALALENLGDTYSVQTDSHVELPVSSISPWPADTWWQFWVYVQRDAGSSKVSEVVGNSTKFIYPLLNGDTTYPGGTEDTIWLLGIAGETFNVLTGTGTDPVTTPTETGAYTFFIRPQAFDGSNPRATIQRLVGSGGENALWPNLYGNVSNIQSVFLSPNKWYLCKFRFKHDGAQNSNTSEYHFWAREKGTLTFTKYAEYIGGATSPLVFDYYNRDSDALGIYGVRIPTTSGSPTGPWGDTWFYMKDLAVGATENDLPTYGSY